MPIALDVSGLFGLAPPRFRVRFPGWEDVIHWQPQVYQNQEDYDRHRFQIYADLRASPTPQVAKDFAQIGQEIDNVQDALVTLSVLGRVGVKLTGRLLPGVGWVATAADVLNLLNVFYPPNAIGITRWFAGKGGKRKSQEFAKLSGGTYRRRLDETVKTGRVGFGFGEALQVLQTTDWLFGFGVSLGPIFGAASDALFGIARGAEFEFPTYDEVFNSSRGTSAGFRVDSYFGKAMVQQVSLGVAGYMGLTLGVLGAEVEHFENGRAAYARWSVSWPGILPLMDLAVGDVPGSAEAQIVRGLSPFLGPAEASVAAVLYAFGSVQSVGWQAAVQLGRALGYLGGYRDVLPWQTHVDMAVGSALLVGLVAPALEVSSWGEVVAPVAERPWWGGPLPLVPEAASLSVGAVCAAVRDRGATAPQVWLGSVPGGMEREFVHALVGSTADLLLGSVESPQVRVQDDSGPLWRAVAGMHEVDLLVPQNRTDAETLRYIEGAAALTPEVGEGYAPRAALEGLYAEIWPDVDSSW